MNRMLNVLRRVMLAVWAHPENEQPTSNWLGIQFAVSRFVTFIVLFLATPAVATRLGARNYEAGAVGLAIAFYGFVGFKYLIIGIGRYAATINSNRGKVVVGYLMFVVLGAPVLLGGVWLFLQPTPQTTWYGRLMWPALAVALIIAGIREAISLAAQVARGQEPPL